MRASVYVSCYRPSVCNRCIQLSQRCSVRAQKFRKACHACAQISGQFKVDGSGNVEFKEEDGIDYAAVTVQLAGGERVPFLFTIKELDAKGNLDGFGGDFLVPSYRGSSFLDPKVRNARPRRGHNPALLWDTARSAFCVHPVVEDPPQVRLCRCYAPSGFWPLSSSRRNPTSRAEQLFCS